MSEPDETQAPGAVPPPSPWISREGDVVHPDAPAGSGGPGRFRTAGSLGAEGNDSSGARHPRAPSVRFETLSGDEKAEVLDGGVKVVEKPRNPPPQTVPESFSLRAATNPQRVEINVKVNVVADGKKPNPAGDAGAWTRLDPSKVKAAKPSYSLPPDAPENPGDDQAIKGVVGKIVVQGEVTIQVQYGDESKPTDEAAWGRGTTSADVAAKDITVGFHESCHLADFKAYLKGTPIPVPEKIFSAKTVREWSDAADKIDEAIDAYFEECRSSSRRKTDEVGTKMSDYVKTHAGVSAH